MRSSATAPAADPAVGRAAHRLPTGAYPVVVNEPQPTAALFRPDPREQQRPHPQAPDSTAKFPHTRPVASIFSPAAGRDGRTG